MIIFLGDFQREIYDDMEEDDIAVVDDRTGIVYQSCWYTGSLKDDVTEMIKDGIL